MYGEPKYDYNWGLIISLVLFATLVGLKLNNVW